MIELMIAFGAGLISFLSPCVLPLIPGYISFISGASLNELLTNKKINIIPLILGGGQDVAYAQYRAYDDRGEFYKVEALYKNSKFFKTLLENSMMSLTKSFFDLTQYMSKDEEFGAFWNLIYEEYLNSKNLLLKLTGYKSLMENEPSGKASIDVREAIVLPLLTIQQYALKKIQELEKEEVKDEEQIKVFEKIVTRSLFGNINASRNSA